MVILREKKQGKKTYYYLEHSVKESGRVVSKKKYLGSERPKDAEEAKRQFLIDILSEKYGTRFERIRKKHRQEMEKYPASAKEDFIERLMVKFTYNSNRIEGSTLSLKETADLLQGHITPANKPVADVKEAQAHRDVFYEVLAYKKELTLPAVLSWHRSLFLQTNEEIAGKIRRHPVGIARSKVALALPAEIDGLLHEFFSWYGKARGEIHPVILAALVHLRFVTIHPFSDGNGRISRLLMNFVLHKHGYPLLIINYHNRSAYYNALERSQLRGKEEIFIEYVCKRFLKEYA